MNNAKIRSSLQLREGQLKMKSLATWSSQRKLLERIALPTAIALFVSIAIALIVPVTNSGFPGGIAPKAYAASGDALAAGSADLGMDTASSGFRASTYYLDLSPKVKKVPYGHKYIPVHKTVTVKIPEGYYPVYWESSNPKVATAKDSYKDKEMKLVVYGNSRGKSTITITNSATYETIRIRVVVKGYNSTDFKASKTKLNLNPKKKKVSGGYKYVPGKQTITVAIPDQAENVYYKSSDYSIADAEWSGKWNGNTTKLTIVGHRPGKATITLTNTKTKKKIKIKVTVSNGYELGFKWGNPQKMKYTKEDGTTDYYWLNNFSLINNTGNTVKLDKRCSVRYWSINQNYDEEYYYVDENQQASIRGVPITIKKGQKKKVYIGERVFNYDKSSDGIWERGIFTVKIGKTYKTIYVDGYGMVTRVLKGRKI